MNWYSGLGNYISNLWRPRKEGGQWFYPKINADTWKELVYLDNFNEIPELNAVINLKARAFSSGCVKVVDKDLKEVENNPIGILLTKPNWFQAQKEFMRQTKLFHEIYGNEYVNAFFGVGIKPESSKAIYTLPPNLVTCELDNPTPFFLTTERPEGVKYTYKLWGKETVVEPETLIHLNDNRVTINEENRKQMLTGESKQRGLKPVLNNMRMAYESRGVILKSRGALGILSNDGVDVSGVIPFKPEEKQELQDAYRNYGSLEGQDQLIISNAKVKWQQMIVNPDKLGLILETQEGFYKICDAYGVPMECFSSKEGRTYENQGEAKKSLYDSTIIPEANEWCTALSMFFFPDGKYNIIMDFSHLAVFQEDIEKSATTLKTMVEALSQALADQVIGIKEYQEQLNKLGIAVGNKPQ